MSLYVAHAAFAARFAMLANGAGLAGIALGASWALLRRRSTILLCQTGGALAFALHFFLLGSDAGAVMCLAGAAQSCAARLPLGRLFLAVLYAASLAAATGITLVTAEGVPASFAALGLLCATTGRLQGDTQRMRAFFLASTGAWAVHNFLVGSHIGNASDALTAAGILAGLWAHRRGAVRGAPARGRTTVPAATLGRAEALLTTNQGRHDPATRID